MKKKIKNDETKNRCQEGWRLFFVVGDLYEFNTKQDPENRIWKKHAAAVEENRSHVVDCSICNPGQKEMQIGFEELVVEDGTGAC